MSSISEQPKAVEVLIEGPSIESIENGAEKKYQVVFHKDEPNRVMDAFQDKVNRKTIMLGSSKPWDKKRLIEGKLKKFEAIGELSVQLRSSQGDALSASHFLHDAFMESLKAHGAEVGSYTLQKHHPFFSAARPAQVNGYTEKGETAIAAARIPYSPELEAQFYDPTMFTQFLRQAGLIALWSDTLEPVGKQAWYYRRSCGQDMIVIEQFDHNQVNKMRIQGIQEADKYSSFIQKYFDEQSARSQVIRFPLEAKEFVQTLEELKINNSPWEIVDNETGFFLFSKNDPLRGVFCKLGGLESSVWSLEFTPYQQPEDVRSPTPGVVILSMNQTNSYVQYTHEILTFLLSGMDVFAYDHAGKGLSRGSVSEAGLKTAIDLSGSYLKEFGYKEEELLFKGQCAGGLPSSAAAQLFPKAHIWIDQSPNNFYELAPAMCKQYIQQEAKKRPGSCLCSSAERSFFLIQKLVAVIAKCILPSTQVIANVEKGKGRIFYSIGITDNQGIGGDGLVPKKHTQQLIQKMGELDTPVTFLPIVGGTHVTDWWIDPTLHDKVMKVLRQEGLAIPVFAPKGVQEQQEQTDL